MAALEAEAGRARAIQAQALGDPEMEHRVSLAAQEDGFAQVLDAERKKQAALVQAKAVALAKAAKVAEQAAEGASATLEAAVAKQR